MCLDFGVEEPVPKSGRFWTEDAAGFVFAPCSFVGAESCL